ncbi:MAG: peptidylprolyl isomerase [Saprospiraceae bacterium]|nr:peptidylprolyl isomerase [Saprospiraceae bacterium]
MRNLSVLLLFLVSMVATLSAQKQVIDKVTATVGGELVLLSEVEEQISLMQAQNGQLPEDARCNIMDQVLITKLMLNQAKLDSIEVSDIEVEEQLNARIDRILSYMNGDIAQFEAYYGQTISAVKDQFREDLKSQLLVERMRGQIMSNVTVTPSEVKTFFAQIPEDSLPYFNSEVEIGEIVYKPKVNSVERTRSIGLLDSLRTLIMEEKETFEEMAKKFSDDGSARIGGDLGWAKRGKYVPDFEAAAYKLEKNEISPVIESQFGFHIIQMLDRRGNSIHVRHILVKPEIQEADLVKAQMHLDSIRNLIEVDSMSFSLAVKLFSDDEEQSYNNDGRMVNPATGNTFFEIGDLDPDVYFAIDTLKLKQVSQPVAFRDPIGEPFFRLVQVQSRTTPHKANLQQDYSKIRKAAIQSKQNEYITKWVADTVGATFIQIDNMYEGCPALVKWDKDGRKKARP